MSREQALMDANKISTENLLDMVLGGSFTPGIHDDVLRCRVEQLKADNAEMRRLMREQYENLVWGMAGYKVGESKWDDHSFIRCK